MLLLWKWSNISCVDPDRGTGGQDQPPPPPVKNNIAVDLFAILVRIPCKKISKPGLSVGPIINSVLLAGRLWLAFSLSSLKIKGQELADTLLQYILCPHMNIQLMIETER